MISLLNLLGEILSLCLPYIYQNQFVQDDNVCSNVLFCGEEHVGGILLLTKIIENKDHAS